MSFYRLLSLLVLHQSRLPGKPLADIAGKPMIQHVFRKLNNQVRAE